MAARTISDRDVARVLYTATGVINPVLDAIEGCDPLGVKKRTFTTSAGDDSLIGRVAGTLNWVTDHSGVPGTAAWDRWSVDERTEWWVGRIGRLSTVLVAYPGVFGAISDRLPIQDLLGFAQQAFVICAVQRVHGCHDRHDQTDQLVAILCDRVVDSKSLLSQPAEEAFDKSRTAEIDLAVEIDKAVESATSERRSLSPVGIVKSVWATVGLLRSIADVLARRPRPRQPWRLLSNLPVVGAVADYVGERSALRRAADAAVASLRAPVRV